MLRIVVALMFLWLPEVREAPARAAVPAMLWSVPEGLHWFVAWVPISSVVARCVQAVALFAALCAIAGVRSRLACGVVAVTGFYLLALSQLSGWVWHDMHVLWMAALLAASPCGDALAFDHRGGSPAPDARRYGVPLTFARALLGCVYVFPGLHKLRSSGVAWALSDNLRNQLYWKWAEHGIVPSLRVDHVPGLLQTGGMFVLLFELGFPFLALASRRTRTVAAVSGLVFHAFMWALLRIPFVSLWALYVVLIDPRWIRRITKRVAPDGIALPPSRATGVVGAALLIGAIVQGARGQMRSFPFACYPTFQWRAGTEMPDLVIEMERADGSRVELPHARSGGGYRTQRQWGEIWSLAGVTDRASPLRLRAYLAQTLAHSGRARAVAGGAVRVRFYRGYRDVRPEHRDAPERRGPLLADEALR